ncbi:MAG: RDD family protein [Betaproteobacteria bacterium]
MNATTPAASGAAAGLWPRFAAMVYETILLVGLVFVSSWLFIKLLGDASHAPMRHVFQGYVVAVCGAYFIYCWRHSGQTLAMKTWGLRLVRNNEQALTLNRALVRYFLAILGLAAGGMGFLWALLDPDRQFLHDRLLGTRIVRAPI